MTIICNKSRKQKTNSKSGKTNRSLTSFNTKKYCKIKDKRTWMLLVQM